MPPVRSSARPWPAPAATPDRTPPTGRASDRRRWWKSAPAHRHRAPTPSRSTPAGTPAAAAASTHHAAPDMSPSPDLPDDDGTLREHSACRKAETTGNVLPARDLCKSPLRQSTFAVPPRRRGSRATQTNGLRLRSWTPACAGVRNKADDRDLRRGLACAVGWPLAIANPALPRQKRLLSLLQSESIYVALKVGDRPARNRIHPLPPALYGC